MTTNRSRRTGRPRLDPAERDRLLAEIARLDETGVGASLAATAEDDAEDDAEDETGASAEAVSADIATPVADAPQPPPPRKAPEPKTAPLRLEPSQSTARAPTEPPATAAPREPEQSARPEMAPPPRPADTPANMPPDAAALAPQLAVTPPGPPAAPTTEALLPPRPPETDVTQNWQALRSLTVDPGVLDRNLVITARRTDPAHGAFDVLRTRLVQALAEKGWRRVAITSPTAGCGKSFTAINLAVTLSRYDQCRTILLDMDLRRPGLAGYLGLRKAASSGDFLRGLTPASSFLSRLTADKINLGQNLAIGLNARIESYAAELFQQKSTADALARMEREFLPEVVLFDLPPALAQDDVIAFRPHFDCILMVVGGGITTAEDVREATRRIGEDKPILGVVLNKAEVEGDYAY